MNTKKIIAVAAMALLIGSQQAGAQWKPVGDKIKTAWVEKVNPKMPWNVYPRPQLKRKVPYEQIAEDTETPLNEVIRIAKESGMAY